MKNCILCEKYEKLFVFREKYAELYFTWTLRRFACFTWEVYKEYACIYLIMQAMRSCILRKKNDDLYFTCIKFEELSFAWKVGGVIVDVKSMKSCILHGKYEKIVFYARIIVRRIMGIWWKVYEELYFTWNYKVWTMKNCILRAKYEKCLLYLLINNWRTVLYLKYEEKHLHVFRVKT